MGFRQDIFQGKSTHPLGYCALDMDIVGDLMLCQSQ